MGGKIITYKEENERGREKARALIDYKRIEATKKIIKCEKKKIDRTRTGKYDLSPGKRV